MRVRLATADDTAAMLAIYAPCVRNSAATFEVRVPSPDEFRERVTTILRQTPWLVAVDGDKIAGYAYAGPHRQRAGYRFCVEVAVYVDAHYRGSGVGQRLYRALLELLRRQGYYHAYGIISLPNPASIALHESVGFVKVGIHPNAGFKQGKWNDVGWWYCPISPATNAAPAEPTALAAMQEGEIGAILDNA